MKPSASLDDAWSACLLLVCLRMKSLLILMPMVVGCVSSSSAPAALDPSGGKADNGKTAKLHPILRLDLDISQPSGLSFDDEGQLWVVSDERAEVCILDAESGERERCIDSHRQDLEGLSFDRKSGALILVDEDAAKLIYIDAATGEKLEETSLDWAKDGNHGPEGVAVSPETGELYVVKESSPAMVCRVSSRGRCAEGWTMNGIDDLSDLTFDEDGRLWLLSDEEQSIYRVQDGKVKERFRIDVDKPEGLAFQDGRLLVVSDEDDEMAVFDLARQ